MSFIFYLTLFLFTLCLDVYYARIVSFTDDPGDCDIKALLSVLSVNRL